MSILEYYIYYISNIWNYKPFDIVLPRYIIGGAPIYIGIYPVRILFFIFFFIVVIAFLKKYKFIFKIEKK